MDDGGGRGWSMVCGAIYDRGRGWRRGADTGQMDGGGGDGGREDGGSGMKEGRMRRCATGVLTFKGTFQVLAKNLEVTGEIEPDKWIKGDKKRILSSVHCSPEWLLIPKCKSPPGIRCLGPTYQQLAHTPWLQMMSPKVLPKGETEKDFFKN